MSILEDVGSTASDASPAGRERVVMPRPRLRARSSRALERQLAAVDAYHGASSRSRDGETTAGDERNVSMLEQFSSSGGGGSRSDTRYDFRTRRAKSGPFDQGLYDEVFDSMRLTPLSDRRSGSTKRRRHVASPEPRKRSHPRSSSSKAAKKKRRRRRRADADEHDHGDDDDDQDDPDDGQDDHATYNMTDESDIEEINRQIAAQERAQARAARTSRSASRAMRYELRSGTASSLSPSKDSGLDGRDNGDEEDDDDGDGKGDEENGSESEREEEDDDDDQETVAQRSASEQAQDEDDDDDDEEDDDEDEGQEEAQHDERRYSLRQRTSKSASANAKASATSSAATLRTTRRARASSFIASDTERRYSLRDRSKVQTAQSDAAATSKDPATASAYAEYAKRQSGRKPAAAAARGRHHSKRPSGKRRRRRHRSDLSSSSSSSSSSSPSDSESSDGGMRRSSLSGKHHSRASGKKKSKSARADITPVEVDRSITWASVGGLESHIEALKEMVMLPLLYPEFYDKYKIKPPSGVLFYGPPGTGKTLLARALANSCSLDTGTSDDAPVMVDGDVPLDDSSATATRRRHVTFYMRKGADCLSKWVGEAERQLRLLFDEAKRNEPSIIFFDEIDGLAPVRSAKQDQIHASIVSTLLALMDGMDARGRVVVIGATNRLDAIDPALRRPGRFDRELGFKLPNVRERAKMLAIHSQQWRPTLTSSFIHELAEHTVGYCGADIKALCAEAALCSLRRTYPQVYASSDKLVIDLDAVVVTRSDFAKAMKKITPASHRSVSSFAAPLPQSVALLLQASLDLVLKNIAKRFPLFPLDRHAIDEATTTSASSGDRAAAASDASSDDDGDDDIYAKDNHDDCDVCHGDAGELLCCDHCPGAFHAACLDSLGTSASATDHGNDEAWYCPECTESGPKDAQAKTLRRALRDKTKRLRGLPRHVGFPRVLITGTPGMGQEYVGAALLHALEGLTHFSLDYPSLVADPNTHHPEEALIARLNEAQKCLPCVLYLPHAELWWENTPDSMHVALKMLLMSMQAKANLPVLFLACTSSSSGDLPVGLLDLFRHTDVATKSSILFQLKETPTKYRRAHFEQVFAAFATAPAPPRRPSAKRLALAPLPLAPLPAPSPSATQAALRAQRERDEHFLRELRIFLTQVLDYAMAQKKFSDFYYPVDPDAVPDYYVIVDEPMDLSTMYEKLNDGAYTTFELFMRDIARIVRNANVFNPKRSATRYIAYRASEMQDTIASFAKRFQKHQGYDLFAKCRAITARLPRAVTATASAAAPTLQPTKTRTSARIRGVKAPELDDTPPRKREARRRSVQSTTTASTSKADERAIKREHLRDGEAQQWFSGDDDAGGRSAGDDARERKGAAARTRDASETVADTDDDENDGGEERVAKRGDGVPPTCAFDIGDHVFVQSRTSPGINREGGAGKITRAFNDGTYSVKYVLGGSERYVEAKFISRLTESAVKESVRNQRASESPHRRRRADGDGVTHHNVGELKHDYFTKLLWPILVDDGWRREERIEIVEAGDDGSVGSATEIVTFYPPPRTDASAPTAIVGVAALIDYIKSDDELATTCFGRRYGLDLADDVVFGRVKASARASTAAAMPALKHEADKDTDDGVNGKEEAEDDDDGEDVVVLAADPTGPAAHESVDLTSSPDANESETEDVAMNGGAEDARGAAAASDAPAIEAAPERRGDDKDGDEDREEEEQEPSVPEFIYDEDRMDAALAALVAKSASWTVEEMSHELMFLNKVAYSFRHKFDRSLLMKVVEDHVASLKGASSSGSSSSS